MPYLPNNLLKHILDYAFPYYQQYERKDLTNALLDTILQVNRIGKIKLDTTYYRGVCKTDELIKTIYQLTKFGIHISPKLQHIIYQKKVKDELVLKSRNYINSIKKSLKLKAVKSNDEFAQMFKVNDIIIYYKSKQTWKPTLKELGWIQVSPVGFVNLHCANNIIDTPTPTQTARLCYTRQINIEPRITNIAATRAGITNYLPHNSSNDICLDTKQKCTIFYRISKVNKKSYTIVPIQMCLGLINKIDGFAHRPARYRFPDIYQYRLTPSIEATPTPDIQYRLDHSQIILDQNKLQLSGSKYPSITKYSVDNDYHALYWGSQERILRQIYHIQ